MSERYQKVCITLIYIENCFILGCTINGSISISAFPLLNGIPSKTK